MEDALDFCDNLDELEITNKRGETKPLEYNSGLFPVNVLAAVKPPSAKSSISQRILSEATVLKMIVLEQDARNHAILHMLYAAGLRVSELCNLRWRHVIRRENGVQLDVVSGKGDKQRHVLLPEGSWHILSDIREGAADTDFVFRSRQEVSREEYYKGTRLDTTTVFRIVREAAKRAGVQNWYEVSPTGCGTATGSTLSTIGPHSPSCATPWATATFPSPMSTRRLAPTRAPQTTSPYREEA